MGRFGYFVALVFWLGISTLLFDLSRFPPIPVITALFIMVPAAASRLESIGYRERWCWLALLPGINVMLHLRCLFAPPDYAAKQNIKRYEKIICWVLGILIFICLDVPLFVSWFMPPTPITLR